MPFLTEIDTRAAVKGSRDPLGIQQIWTRLGREVVVNLTTVSTSVRDFGTLLLGYHFAEVVADDVGPGQDLATFIKWEQLAAYARAGVNSDLSFRGTEKVSRLLNEGSRLWLSDDRHHQILASQKMYGLWGLYTGPARTSGLLEGEPTRLTAKGREFVDGHYLPLLGGRNGRSANRIRELLGQKRCRIDITASDASTVQAVAKALPKKLAAAERRFYRDYLLYADGCPDELPKERQRQFAELMRSTLGDKAWRFSPQAIDEFMKQAAFRGTDWEPLHERLKRIRTCETVMAPAADLFGYMLGLHDTTVKSLADRLASTWGAKVDTIELADFGLLWADLGGGDADVANRWIAVAEGLATGDYQAAVTELVQQNRSVMMLRGGVAWIEKRGRLFDVRVRDENGRLPDRKQLQTLWRFPYFLESLRDVAMTLAEDGDG